MRSMLRIAHCAGVLLIILNLIGCSNNERREAPLLSPVDIIEVDPSFNTGLMKKLIFSSGCEPNIFYTDDIAGTILHAYPSSGTWSIESVSPFSLGCVRGIDVTAIRKGSTFYAFSANTCLEKNTVNLYYPSGSTWVEQEIFSTPDYYITDLSPIFYGGRLYVYVNAVTNTAQSIFLVEGTPGSSFSPLLIYTSSGSNLNYYGLYSSTGAVIKGEFVHLFFYDVVNESLRHLQLKDGKDAVLNERPEWLRVEGETLNFSAYQDGFVAQINTSIIENLKVYRDGEELPESSYSVIDGNEIFIPSTNFLPGAKYTASYETPRERAVPHGEHLKAEIAPDGTTYVAYSDLSGETLSIAISNSSPWTFVRLHLPGFDSSSFSISLDNYSFIHVFYRDTLTEDLEYTAFDAFSFSYFPETIPVYTTGVVGINPDSDICKGRVGVAFSVLKYSSETGEIGSRLLFLIY